MQVFNVAITKINHCILRYEWWFNSLNLKEEVRLPNFDFKEQELEMIPSLKSDCLNIYCRESLWIALRDLKGIQKMNP